MTTTPATDRRDVRLLFVGNRHNDPALGKQRPGIRVAQMPEVGPVAHVFVLYTAGDEKAKAHAEALARDLGHERRGGSKVTVTDLNAGSPSDPLLRRNVKPAVDKFVEKLATSEFGARFEQLNFVVSTVTGTAAQWTCLIDALDARGAGLAIVWEREDQRLSIWRSSPELRAIEPMLRLLERAPAAWNVLLTGPTGSGKTETARRLHNAWSAHLHRGGHFMAVNAGALPPQLLQSELFGHVKGAFTGADSPRDGAFRKAHGGTLFLDEIGDLPLELQVQLLTVLDIDASRRRSVTPVGSDKAEQVDVRVIFGTNQDLPSMASDRRFRLDLLGRISTHHVRLPGLDKARHRIASAYVHHLESLAPLYASSDGRAARFSFEGEARRRLLDFAFAPTSAWTWNHRDVQQSAERLAMRAWRSKTSGDDGKKREKGSAREEQRKRDAAKRGDDAPRTAMITVAHVEAEIAELNARWRSLSAGDGGDDGAWRRVEARLNPGEWAKLSMVERWELRYLLEARDASANNAEAWRKIGEQNLLEGAADPASQRNPSNAFQKRWRRYEHRLRS